MSLVHLGWIDMTRRRYDEAHRWVDAWRWEIPPAPRADAETAVRLRPPSDPLAAEDVLLALELRSVERSDLTSHAEMPCTVRPRAKPLLPERRSLVPSQ